MLNRKITLCTIAAGIAGLLIAANASATTPVGTYVGGQLGWGKTREANNTTHTKLNTSGIAGRVSAGYQFNPNIAIETGITKFSNGASQAQSITGRTYAVDLVAKGIMPLDNGFGVYGKAGAAYVGQSIKYQSLGYSTNQHKVYPTVGAGVSYDLTTNVSSDLSWNRIQKVGSGNLKSTDLVSLGLAYHFNS
jgi:opacity protein-like surface antigen